MSLTDKELDHDGLAALCRTKERSHTVLIPLQPKQRDKPLLALCLQKFKFCTRIPVPVPKM